MDFRCGLVFYGVSDYAYEKSENLPILALYPYNICVLFRYLMYFF